MTSGVLNSTGDWSKGKFFYAYSFWKGQKSLPVTMIKPFAQLVLMLKPAMVIIETKYNVTGENGPMK